MRVCLPDHMGRECCHGRTDRCLKGFSRPTVASGDPLGDGRASLSVIQATGAVDVIREAMSSESDIDPEMLRLLGSIVTKWAYVEMALLRLLAHIMGASPGFMSLVTQSISAAHSIEWARALLNYIEVGEEIRAHAKALFDGIDDLRLERNEIVHGHWRAGGAPGRAFVETTNLRRPEIISHRLLTISDLRELDAEIGKASEALWMFAQERGANLPKET